MATEQGDPGRRTFDPLVGAVSDGVAAGYEALEHVAEGLRESLRLRAATEWRREPGRRQQAGPAGARSRFGPGRPEAGARYAGGRGAPRDVVDDLAEILAELFDRAADLAQDVAESITERPRVRPGPALCPRLELKAGAGDQATVEFRVSNTGSTALHDVKLTATKLIGRPGRIRARAVTFSLGRVERIGPGRSITAKVAVTIPAQTAAGVYRGLVQADPGGAWAVLELTVAATHKDEDLAPRRAPDLAV